MTFLCAWVLCGAVTRALPLELARPALQTSSKSTTPSVQAAPGSSSPAVSALEAEVLANLKREPVGTATLADLDMPDEYLKRVAGRILRASFEENFRIVVPDEKPADAPGSDAQHAQNEVVGAEHSTARNADGSSRASDESDMGAAPGERSSSASPGESSSRVPPWAVLAGAGFCGLAIAFGISRARRRPSHKGARDR